jgi:hypothetical protein
MLKKVVTSVGMMPVGDPVVIHYPPPSDSGQIALQPFTVCQPLMESYIRYLCPVGVVDYSSWPEAGYANMVVNSCKRYETINVLSSIYSHIQGVKIKAVVPPEYYDGVY